MTDADCRCLYELIVIHKQEGRTLLEFEDCRTLHRFALTPKEYLQQRFRELER